MRGDISIYNMSYVLVLGGLFNQPYYQQARGRRQ